MNGDKDSTTEYAYDANGNMTFDYNKKIAVIKYNVLNLPDKLQYAYGHTIGYLYDAAGSKLSVADTTVNTNLLVPLGGTVPTPVPTGDILTTMKTDYCGNIIYEDGVLSKILTEEGYVTLSGSTAVFHYYLKDHEGNNRVVLNQNGTVEQVNNYYPFGGLYGDNTGGSVQPYMYNGKELDRMHGLDLFDYGQRMYDPQIGRWTTPDPKTELLEMSSPYVYSLNSPLNYKDKDGELPIFINGLTQHDCERASAIYWTAEILNTIKNSGIPNPGGEINFVDGNRFYSHCINLSTGKEYGITNAYALTGNDPGSRYEAGYKFASQDLKNILSKLAKDPKTGKVIEKIQIYTHSRGAAFGAGYTTRLLELIKQNSDLFANPNNEIDFVLNMAPHQSWSIKGAKGAKEYSIHHNDDWISGNEMGGLQAAFSSNEGDGMLEAHSISSFKDDLNSFTRAFFSGNSSQSKIDYFIKYMKDIYGINVTVKQ